MGEGSQHWRAAGVGDMDTDAAAGEVLVVAHCRLAGGNSENVLSACVYVIKIAALVHMQR